MKKLGRLLATTLLIGNFSAIGHGQIDVGVNVAGALLSRGVALVELPLDSIGTWSVEAGVYYGSRAELREQGSGRVLARERNYGVVLDARRYFTTKVIRTGFFAGPWLRLNRYVYADRRFDPVREDRRFETSLGLLIGYKHLPARNVFIEPVIGAGTTVLNLVDPVDFGGDDVLSLTADYVLRLRAGIRF